MNVYPVPGINSFLNYQEFTDSGTWYRPPQQKLTLAYIQLIGGGGGGGYGYAGVIGEGGGGGGGGGAMTQRGLWLSGSSYSFTKGAGGAGGTSGHTNGYAGGVSTFGSILEAKGGNYGVDGAGGGGGGNGAGRQTYVKAVSTMECASSPFVVDLSGHAGGAKKVNGTAAYEWSFTGFKAFSGGTGAGRTGGGGGAGYRGNGGVGGIKSTPGGTAGDNTGAGGGGGSLTSGAGLAGGNGGSGYCIVFWEETLKTKKFASGVNMHFRKQEFSGSTTWYRPKRYPATLAYVFLRNTDNSKSLESMVFLIEDSYAVTIGATSSFGSLFATNTTAAVKTYNDSSVYKYYSTQSIRAFLNEIAEPTYSYIMWWE